MDNKYYYANIPEALLRDANISQGAKVTYGILESYGATPFLKHETIAKHLKLSPKSIGTVKRFLYELRVQGWISWRKRGFGKSNLYILNKVSTKLIDAANQLSTNPSISSTQSPQLASQEAANNYQFSDYHLIEKNEDGIFDWDEIDAVGNAIYDILEDYCCKYDMRAIEKNIRFLINHYGHLDLVSQFYKLRDTINGGIKSENRIIDPAKHLLLMLDQEDRMIFSEIKTRYPHPSKQENQEEYQAKIKALRTKNYPSCFNCPLCGNFTSQFSAEFHETYFKKWSGVVLEELRANPSFTKIFTVNESKVLMQMLTDGFDYPLCVDCILRASVHNLNKRR